MRSSAKNCEKINKNSEIPRNIPVSLEILGKHAKIPRHSPSRRLSGDKVFTTVPDLREEIVLLFKDNKNASSYQFLKDNKMASETNLLGRY